MSRKLNYESKGPFFDRLYGLFKDDVKGWTKKLGVSKGTIVNRWFKGTYPGSDNLMKICKETEKTADWLLFGTEPASTDKYTALLEKIDRFRDELDLYREKVKVLELEKGVLSDTPKELAKSTGQERKVG